MEDWEMDEVANLRDKMEDKKQNKMVHGWQGEDVGGEEKDGGEEGEVLRKSNQRRSSPRVTAGVKLCTTFDQMPIFSSSANFQTWTHKQYHLSHF